MPRYGPSWNESLSLKLKSSRLHTERGKTGSETSKNSSLKSSRNGGKGGSGSLLNDSNNPNNPVDTVASSSPNKSSGRKMKNRRKLVLNNPDNLSNLESSTQQSADDNSSASAPALMLLRSLTLPSLHQRKSPSRNKSLLGNSASSSSLHHQPVGDKRGQAGSENRVLGNMDESSSSSSIAHGMVIYIILFIPLL